jgi:hypothetical protein
MYLIILSSAGHSNTQRQHQNLYCVEYEIPDNYMKHNQVIEHKYVLLVTLKSICFIQESLQKQQNRKKQIQLDGFSCVRPIIL